jgi:hypothetical protein
MSIDDGTDGHLAVKIAIGTSIYNSTYINMYIACFAVNPPFATALLVLDYCIPVLLYLCAHFLCSVFTILL